VAGRDFRRLQAWHKTHALVLAIYRASAKFPSDERFGLTSQVRRACVSIPANIAEGCDRHPDDDFARSLDDAMGSASEVGVDPDLRMTVTDPVLVQTTPSLSLAWSAYQREMTLMATFKTVRARVVRVGEEQPHLPWNGQHPWADGDGGEDLVDHPGGEGGHPPAAAGRAESPPLAGEEELLEGTPELGASIEAGATTRGALEASLPSDLRSLRRDKHELVETVAVEPRHAATVLGI